MGSTLRRLRKQFPLPTVALEVFSIVLGVLLSGASTPISKT
jgi:hypothetical protein